MNTYLACILATGIIKIEDCLIGTLVIGGFISYFPEKVKGGAQECMSY